MSRCLSVRQPWASLLAHSIKRIENRSWPTHYRGLVLLHAGKKSEHKDPRIIDYCAARGADITKMELLRGGIVGIANLVDCVTYSKDPWFQGEYGFVFEQARLTEFIPAKGNLGLYHPGSELLSRIADLGI